MANKFAVFFVFSLVYLVACWFEFGDSSADAMPRKPARAPSLFSPDDDVLHKYSAALAIADSLKMQCQLELRRSMEGWSYFFHRLSGKDPSFEDKSWRESNKVYAAAFDRYEKKLEDAIKNCGLTVEEFNKLSTQIDDQPNLKEKVLLQSYYYRVTSELDKNLKRHAFGVSKVKDPTLVTTAGAETDGSVDGSVSYLWAKVKYYGKGVINLLKNRRKHAYLSLPPSEKDSRFTAFCKALSNIEELRDYNLQDVQTRLGISKLPEYINDPNYFHTFCKPLQQVVQKFPKQANLVIAKHGLSEGEFNDFLAKSRGNFIFRKRVLKEIQDLEQLSEIDSSY